MRSEGTFKADLIKDIETLFPGCFVLKNDPTYIQGFPDITILYKHMWAVLECKRSINEPYRKNQEYYIGELNNMSYSSMVCPENKEAVLYELQQTFGTRRNSRIPRR